MAKRRTYKRDKRGRFAPTGSSRVKRVGRKINRRRPRYVRGSFGAEALPGFGVEATLRDVEVDCLRVRFVPGQSHAETLRTDPESSSRMAASKVSATEDRFSEMRIVVASGHQCNALLLGALARVLAAHCTSRDHSVL